MTSERIKKLQAELPKTTVSEIDKMSDMLPYMDESELYVFWLCISSAFLDGERKQIAETIKSIEKNIGGAR